MAAGLYEKYKVSQYTDLSDLNPLSFILRKAEIGFNLTDVEWRYLDQCELLEAKSIIKSQQECRDALRNEIRSELMRLRRNQFVSISLTTLPPIDSEVALVLYKVNAQQRLEDSELRFVGNGYHRFIEFNEKKQKYRISENIPFEESSEAILSKVDQNVPLSSADIAWIIGYKAYSFLNSLKDQFSVLQKKYKAHVHQQDSADSLALFQVLQKLDENKRLNEAETRYLSENGYAEAANISRQIEFAALKKKFRATEFQSDDASSHLYKVLKKLEAGLSLPEPDINYLKKRKLNETLKFAYKKEADSLHHKIQQGYGLRPEDIVWCEEHDFKEIVLTWLKKDFGVEGYRCGPESLLYGILKKLEAGIRLSDDDVIWLEGENLLKPSDQLYIAHHKLEAQFYEQEFQSTKNYWNVASSSSHWRKAENPKSALKLTDSLDLSQIKPAKLRAALFTTRGGALRDIESLDEAEQCALAAIKHYPESHNPYTLMGALCYGTGRYDEGYRWFEEAVKRGAEPCDQDAEIKRILRKKKKADRKALIDYLLQKDPYRFSWVKEYI